MNDKLNWAIIIMADCIAENIANNGFIKPRVNNALYRVNR